MHGERVFKLDHAGLIGRVAATQLQHDAADAVELGCPYQLALGSELGADSHRGSKLRMFFKCPSRLWTGDALPVCSPAQNTFDEAREVLLINGEALVAAVTGPNHRRVGRERIIEKHGGRNVVGSLGSAAAVDARALQTFVQKGSS